MRCLIRMLQLLQTEIGYGAPLAEALDSAGRAAGGAAAGFCQSVVVYLRRHGAAGVPQAWECGLQYLAGKGCYRQEDLAVLREIGPVLGRSDTADQTRHLQIVTGRLEHLQTQVEEETGKSVRLWRVLSLAGSCMLILVLL